MLDMQAAGASADVRDPEDSRRDTYRQPNIGPAASTPWAGIILDRRRGIVIVAAPGREEEAAMRLGRIGFDHVAGY